MATYKSQYTGQQIDQAVGNALNKDTSTLSNDVNHIPASSVVKSALNTVDESIAIRVSGNKTTYASGAAIGQYVIVSDSTIMGIADGLYKAAKAIPYNTVIDSTYLTAASGGGLNDLKAALDGAGSSVDASTLWLNTDFVSRVLGTITKIGKVVNYDIAIELKSNAALTTTTNLIEFPNGFRPTSAINTLSPVGNTQYDLAFMHVATNGVVRQNHATTLPFTGVGYILLNGTFSIT